MSRKRRNHLPDFKAKVALAAVKGDETMNELSKRFGINANFDREMELRAFREFSGRVASGKGLA